MAKGADFMMARRGIMDSVFPSIEKAARIVSGVERLCVLGFTAIARCTLAPPAALRQGPKPHFASQQGLRWPGLRHCGRARASATRYRAIHGVSWPRIYS